MRSVRFLLSGLALILAIFGTSVESKAQFLGGGFGPWGGFWNQPAFGVGGSLYGSGYIPVPPYHSIHPPVYYSGRVYRPYGDSPYAYFPERFELPRAQSRQASVDEIRPEMIVNPFFQPSGARPANESAAASAVGNSNAEQPASQSTPKKKANPLPAPKTDDNAAIGSAGHHSLEKNPQLRLINNPYVNGRMGGTARIAVTISAPSTYMQ